ncbi:hypothetical protein M9435_003284 [Picochlorum sp. BPE23]|nr:hypothetical protein M9435_003284 [Picochlorum sp. BPE23]
MSNVFSSSAVLTLYRRILKAAKQFPSIKRDDIIKDIKVEFRENRNIADSHEREEKIRIAQRSLEELESYVEMHQSSDTWTKTLKGSCE